MRVLFLQQQPCIRTLKYAAGLRGAPGNIRLGFAYRGRTLSEWYGSGDELFEGWWRLGPDPAAGLAREMAEFAPQVIHSHNLPDALTVVALDIAGGRVPVIHDVHDLQSLRRTPYEDGFPEPEDPLALEATAVRESDALLTVSPELLAEVASRYGLPPVSAVFPNYALRRDLPAELPPVQAFRDGAAHLVYQGTLSTTGSHYDLRDIFTAIASQGLRLDVYPSRPQPAYLALAGRQPTMRCHDRLPPSRLLEVLPRYDFGWAGFNATLNGPHLDTALPNKAFEYLGCGLPVLTLGHRALARLVREEGVGISLPALEGLPQALEALDLPLLRRHIASVRLRFTIEAHIHEVVELYETVARG
jgi:glycosyltransferase involved in cell wall biosynthesis